MPTARKSSDWGMHAARLLLAAAAALMVLSALAVQSRDVHRAAEAAQAGVAPLAEATKRDDDLQLYDSIVERVAAGGNYYEAAIAEQRARSFPVRPGFAVRLPTLAWLQALLGPGALRVASLLLLAAIGLAWWRRLGEDGAAASERRFAVALILAGSSFLLNGYYHALHELWAGGLVALALGLHRPGRWWPALAAAALALAIRELALPFVLLMGAMAAWRRDWKEASAWGALVLAFAVVLGWHHSVIADHWLSTDPHGPSWLVLRGLAGWVGNLVQSSQLHFLPAVLGGPLLVLALLGWAGRRGAAAATATLLLLGYALAFMIAGRDNNFYWGLLVTPLSFAGLAFLPRSLCDLWQAATRRSMPAGGEVYDDDTEIARHS